MTPASKPPSKSMSRGVYAALAIALAVVIFVAINIASMSLLTTWRLDLTANGQFTLSEGTRNIIVGLPEPITIKFYYSKQVASDYSQVAEYAQRVRDMLGEYASLSHGKIAIEEIDPVPSTEAEDQASAAGLTGIPIDGGDTIYFGVVGTNRIDGREVIPYFSPDREQYLEYDLSTLVYRLSTPKKPLIGIITSLPMDTGPGGMAAMMQGQGQPYVTYLELSQTFATQMVPQGFTEIPTNVDVLMIAHPAGLGDEQLRAIDQFVLRGGRALVFVDPSSELATQGANPYQPPTSPPASDLPKLLRAWGVDYSMAKIVGDRKRALQVPTRDPMNPTVLYPVWLHLTAETGDFNTKDPITASMQTLNLARVGALNPLKGATTTFTPLVTSSEDAGLLDTMAARTTQAPDDLMNMIVPARTKFTIAARISGTAKSAFPGAPIKEGKVNVIVMADGDIFDDRFWVRVQTLQGGKIAAPFADNGAFVLNAIENLTGSGDLISLRTRETVQRPFTVVQDIQAGVQRKFEAEQKRLQAHLVETQQALHDIKQGGEAEGTEIGLTDAQKAKIESFQRDLTDTRTQLRDVQHNLRKDIDMLGRRLAFANIALVPILIGVFAIVLAALRRRRRRRALAM